MKRRNIIALTIFLLFYVCFGVFLTVNQERIIYQPFPQDFDSCDAFRDAEKVEQNGTRMYVKDLDKPVVVLYHGNAGSACDRDFYADIFSGAGYGYVVVEYAGYSNDLRQTTHDLVTQDVVNVVAFLQAQRLTNVTVVGESVGTGAAAYHVSVAPPGKLLLISPFTNLTDAAKNRFWFYPTSLLIHDAFDNVSHLSAYTGETTIIHGTSDSLIPYELGEKLYATLDPDTAHLIPITGAGHNDLFVFEETYAVMQDFLTIK